MRKLRFGMVGGGEGAFIGQVHRRAAELDGMAELVCGAFSSDAARSRRSGAELYRIPEDRCYATFADMFEAEAARPEGARMRFVVVATPNHPHYQVAAAALESGFHVMCDKPVTFNLDESLRLCEKVAATGRDHIIRVTEKAFDDFAASGVDRGLNRRVLGLDVQTD